ncbi:sphingomyelinase [Leptospira mayottensis]|uniref:sphingomyelinase n=1 Tax=Leptospira mayottensis TaxID=1137606 RepID=UPI000E360C26|nr:sphingomyelinase C [Leptospira mayottensis]AXR69801.1 sphingomyelinase C [Leptospira mayottensis]
MKMMQKIFQKEKAKRQNKSKISKYSGGYCVLLLLFFLNCMPNQQLSENSLLLSLLSLPNDPSIEVEKDRSMRKAEPKARPKRKYDGVTFISNATGKRIQANSKTPNGWLKVDASRDTYFTRFNLYQDGGDPNCIKSGRIRVETSANPKYYWNWWAGGGGGNYAYYPKYNDGSNRLVILVISGGCLKSGGKVAFGDHDTFGAGYDYYITNWNGGSWNEYLFLWVWTLNPGPREIFTAILSPTPPEAIEQRESEVD